LKRDTSTVKVEKSRVAPRAGAWIETRKNSQLPSFITVAPRAGAWIETGYIHSKGGEIEGRPPCGGVD